MKQNNLLLIIDAQNDFCLPEGALYVQGATGDIESICKFIDLNRGSISEVILTQDIHQSVDISHRAYWYNSDKEHPSPFTTITLEDLKSGSWQPLYNREKTYEYLERLEIEGEFQHTIWPDHCIEGTVGAEIVESIMEVCKGMNVSIVQKGMNPHTEHFGALRANVMLPEDSSTQLNEELVTRLRAADSIFVCGEAKSHCVANTIKQMCEIDGLIEHTTLLEDGCSNILGFEESAESIYQRAEAMGLKRGYTTDIKL